MTDEEPAFLDKIDPEAPLPPHFTIMRLRDLQLPWYPVDASGVCRYVDDLPVPDMAASDAATPSPDEAP